MRKAIATFVDDGKSNHMSFLSKPLMCLRVLSSLEAIIDVNSTNSSTNDTSRSAGYGLRINVIGGIPKFGHISEFIRAELHWLPMHRRIAFKILMLMRNCLAGQAPV